MTPTNPVVNEAAEAREYLIDFPEIILLESVIRDRKIYRDAMSEGMGVIEMDNDKASSEITNLMDEVFND